MTVPSEPSTSSTATPTQRLTPELSDVLYENPLEAQGAGWPALTVDVCSYGFRDGGYRIDSADRFAFCRADVDFDPSLSLLSAVRVEVDATFLLLPETTSQFGPGAVGLGCMVRGSGGSADGYLAEIGPDGYYSIVRYDKGSGTTLAEGTDAPVRVAREVPVRLVLEYLGGMEEGELTSFRFLVDGRTVATAVDREGLPAGSVSVVGHNFVGKRVAAHLRDIVVFGPDDQG